MARSLTAQEAQLYASKTGYQVATRVLIKDSSGNWQDLSNLASYNWIAAATWNQGVDDPVVTAQVTLFRERFKLSLASLMGGSRLNNGGSLIDTAREIQIQTATIPMGQVVNWASQGRMVFHGYVDAVDFGPTQMKVTARDLGSRLQSMCIRKQTAYSDAGGHPVETLIQQILDNNICGLPFATSTPYTLGDTCSASVSGTTYGFRVTTAGTSAGSAPSWSTTTGSTTTSGTVTFTCTGPGVVLNTPVSPLWIIPGPWTQQQVFVMDACKALSDQIGWDLKYRWNATLGDYQLTLSQPNRSGTTADFTIDASRYLEVRTAVLDATNARNFVQVTYGDPADLDSTGMPKRKTQTAVDMTSVAKYGERFMAISEQSSSQIDTAAEALTMAQNCLSDLSQPLLNHELDCSYLHHLELGDLVLCKANGIHYDSDQLLAIVSITHSLDSSGKARTTLGLRGKPASNFENWLNREARPGQLNAPTFSGPAAPTAVTANPTSRGANITFTPPSTSYSTAELHLSTTSGFTPSTSSLKQTITGTNAFQVTDLTPGTTYYAKVIARDAKGNQSSASTQITFSPGYTTPGILQPGIDYSVVPLNGGFEANNNGSGNPPDSWSASSWNTNVLLETGASASGSNSIRFKVATGAGAVTSNAFPCNPSRRYLIGCYAAYSGSPSGNVVVNAIFYDRTGSVVGTTQAIALSASTTTFARQYGVVTTPSNAASMRVQVNNPSAGAGQGDMLVDQVFAYEFDLDAAPVITLGTTGAPSFQNSWTAYGTGWIFPCFWKDPFGVVHLEGHLKGGTLPNVIFTLPVGYRPRSNKQFVTGVSNAFALLTIDPTGNVAFTIPSSGGPIPFATFAGVTFLADG